MIANPQKSSRRPAKRAKTDSTAVLLKPFRIPIQARSSTSSLPLRRARSKFINYAEDQPASPLTVLDANVERHKGSLCTYRKKENLDPELTLRKHFTVPLSRNAKKSLNTFGIPLPPPPLGTRRKPNLVPRPLYDPCGEFAIVLYDPTVDDDPEQEQQLLEENDNPQEQTPPTSQPSKKHHKSLAEILGISLNDNEGKRKYPNVPVVIDPRLTKILRPHQLEGVKFLYRCVTGLIDKRAFGCIMADEMGLGKTLQCIALMWTLLKQSPQGKRTIDKCIIVCPSSLVKNWANELIKWLGEGAINPFAVDGKSTKSKDLASSLRQWAQATGRSIVRPVLIISYETLRRNVTELGNSEVGLMLCDEGHRLKNGESLTFTALDSLNVKRRVILSGTPIQNDLSEYFSLLNFANPNLIGTRIEFRKNYELSILRGRDADATEKEVLKGNEKLSELNELVSKFIIRRTNDILSKYLPIKYEHVVFVELSSFQKKLYNHFITSPEIKKLLKGVGSQPLKAIGLLKKLCNHPALLNLPDDIEGCDDLIPDDYIDPNKNNSCRNREIQTWFSGKFMILERMLYTIKKETNDKIVLISNYTQTLDLLDKMCRSHRYGVLRLDGTMNINKRQKLVDKFNDPNGEEFVFLLSSKAGGCGLNLIGANRLILIDPDWNPAADQQALARVWRDGQKKDCFVYRFITTGTIEEKIFQRQSMKLSLSSCVVDEVQDVDRLFSSDNLRQLFQYHPNTVCDTHDTFKCKRCKNGKQFIKSPAMLYGDSTTWNHVNNEELSKTEDMLLKNESGNQEVSFVFQYVSH